MTHWPFLILVSVYGACVGSFLNVVIYRLPHGQSLIRPSSRCPKCGHALAVYDNVPVLGWLWLRGKCRYCKTAISVQYPLVEAAVAAMFAGLYWVNYQSGLRTDFYDQALIQSWPAYIVQLALLAGLFAATLIDARYYIIPLIIPYTVILVALAILPAASAWVPTIGEVVPVVTPDGVAVAVGGAGGLAVSLILMRLHLIPRSFDDEEDDLQIDDEQQEFPPHPHPRREVLKECLFLAPPIAGMILGFVLAESMGLPDALWVRIIGGALCGYLVGGGLVWVVRIIGTLGFGKEAMGLGDVHLVGAIGAVLGWREAVLVFFLAPFLGLLGTAVLRGFGHLLRMQGRMIPYGPYLAGAAILVMIWREPMLRYFGIVQGG